MQMRSDIDCLQRRTDTVRSAVNIPRPASIQLIICQSYNIAGLLVLQCGVVGIRDAAATV